HPALELRCLDDQKVARQPVQEALRRVADEEALESGSGQRAEDDDVGVDPPGYAVDRRRGEVSHQVTTSLCNRTVFQQAIERHSGLTCRDTVESGCDTRADRARGSSDHHRCIGVHGVELALEGRCDLRSGTEYLAVELRGFRVRMTRID